jgi:hypothetical protein
MCVQTPITAANPRESADFWVKFIDKSTGTEPGIREMGRYRGNWQKTRIVQWTKKHNLDIFVEFPSFKYEPPPSVTQVPSVGDILREIAKFLIQV